MQQRMDGGVSKVVTKVIKGMRISKEKREEEDRHMAALRNLGKETDSGGGEASRQSQDGGFGVDESGIRGSDPSGSPSTSGGRGTDHSEPSARAGREASKDSKWKMVRGASVRGLGSGVSGQAEGLGLWIMDGGGKRRSRWERMQQRIGAGAGKAETVPQKQPSWITELAKVGEEVDAELAQKPHPMKGKLELKLEDSDSDKSYITSDDEGQGPEAAEEQEALAAQGWGEWVTAGEDEVLCVWDFKESDEAPSVRMSISFGGQSITSMFVDWRKLPSGEMEALLVAAMVDKQFR